MNFLALFLLFFLVSLPSFSQTYDFSEVEDLLDDSISLFQGNVYNVIYRDNQLVHQYQAGEIGRQTQNIPIASATKWISATIMLKLQEEGWFALDDTVGTFLPVFTENGKGHISIRHAYSMTTGLLNEGNSGREYHRNSNLTLDQSVDSIAIKLPLEFEPGTHMAYDGSMMHVCGKIAEVVDEKMGNNRDWRTIAKDEFFDPLGMNDSDYTRFFPENPAIAGGIRTSADDYLKVLQMIANNGLYEDENFLSPSSVNEIFTFQFGDLPLFQGGVSEFPHHHPDYADELDTVRYSFGGWVIERTNGNGNPEIVISPGAFGTFPWVDKSRNMYGIMFTQLRAGGGQKLVNTFLRMMKLTRHIIDQGKFIDDTFTVKMSLGNESYFDPEVSSEQDLIVFQDQQSDAWIAEIDPLSGGFITPYGKETLLDQEVLPLQLSWNGPEFGVNKDGWAIYYTKEASGQPQLWKGIFDGETVTNEQITFGGEPKGGILASTNHEIDQHLSFIQGDIDNGNIHWLNERDPAQSHFLAPFERGQTAVRWIPNAEALVISKKDEHQIEQLFIVDADNVATQITSGPHRVIYPFALISPELSGDLVVGGIVNDYGLSPDTLITYRKMGDSYEPYMKVPAPDPSYPLMASPEAFHFQNQSFISLQTEDEEGVGIQNAQFWIVNLDGSIVHRADDGVDPVRRTDLEPYVGSNDVFVYYNILNQDLKWQMWRTKTGLADRLMEEEILTAVEEGESFKNQPKFFPNPAHDIVWINWPKGYLKEGMIIDVFGQTVGSFTGDEIDLRHYPNGIYFVLIPGAKTVRLVISHP
jgi:CubicO group peptidase (beta-lactamase class C family)